MIPETQARGTIGAATADVAPDIERALRLSDDHQNLNMVLRQLMNVMQNNAMAEEERRGVLAQ